MQLSEQIFGQVKGQLKRVRGVSYKLLHAKKEKFTCPVCRYTGPFADALDPTGKRENAMCPNCSSVERHRVFWLTLEELAKRHNFQQLSLLHFAPEPQLVPLLKRRFKSYETADLCQRGVDHKVDLRKLPFPAESYDVVIASHVLEHIKEDTLALENIKRILKPNGFAILQVPIVGEHTVEYPEPNAQEWLHVRAPGEDYFDRYKPVFTRVDKYRSSQFENRYQPYVYENRTRWPAAYPLRPRSQGYRHEDIVPVCYL